MEKKLIDLENGIFLDLNHGETIENIDLFLSLQENKPKKERRIKERRNENHPVENDERIFERRARYIPSKEDVLFALRKYGYFAY